MKDAEFKLLKPIVDLIDGRFGELYIAGAFDEILLRMKMALAQFPDTYSITLDIGVNAFA